MEFSVLGPVEIRVDGVALPLNGSKPRALLAALLLDINSVLSQDRLVDLLWGDQPPRTAGNTLQVHVATLRRLIATGDGRHGVRLDTRAPGYGLSLDPMRVDLYRFRSGVQRGRSAAGAGDDHAARSAFRAALAQWQGGALADVAGVGALGRFADALEEERLAATEELYRVELRLGNAAQVVGDLTTSVAEHPLRESLRALLMRALHDCGRSTDALRVYQDGRAVLADEMGLDPGPALRDLHLEILRGSAPAALPARDAAAAPPARDTAATGPAGRNDLPSPAYNFIGREAEIARLTQAAERVEAGLDRHVLLAIDGMGGVGKTALALQVAHALAPRFTDLSIYVDLGGHANGRPAEEPGEVLEHLLDAAGVPAARVPAGVASRSALWRAVTADRRVLLVLDDAASAAQISPLVPAGPGCVTLVTGRHRFAGLDARQTLWLDMLPEADSIKLLTSELGVDRASADPGAVADIARTCGYLPVAMRLAAARARQRPGWPLSDLAKRLGRRGWRFGFGVGEDAALTFQPCHAHLTGAQRRLLLLAAYSPVAEIDPAALATLAGMTRSATVEALDQLVNTNLVEAPGLGVYRLNELVQRYTIWLAEHSLTP